MVIDRKDIAIKSFFPIGLNNAIPGTLDGFLATPLTNTISEKITGEKPIEVLNVGQDSAIIAFNEEWKLLNQNNEEKISSIESTSSPLPIVLLIVLGFFIFK